MSCTLEGWSSQRLFREAAADDDQRMADMLAMQRAHFYPYCPATVDTLQRLRQRGMIFEYARGDDRVYVGFLDKRQDGRDMWRLYDLITNLTDAEELLRVATEALADFLTHCILRDDGYCQDAFEGIYFYVNPDAVDPTPRGRFFRRLPAAVAEHHELQRLCRTHTSTDSLTSQRTCELRLQPMRPPDAKREA